MKGLNDEYSHVRSQIMMMEPFPPISKAFSLVAQQEREFHMPNVDTELKYLNADSGKAYNVTGNYSNLSNKGKGNFHNRGRGRQDGYGNRNQGRNRLCTHCNKTNHTIDTCYFLHGFPPGYQSRTTTNKSGSSVNLASGSIKIDEDQKSASDTTSNGVLLS